MLRFVSHNDLDSPANIFPAQPHALADINSREYFTHIHRLYLPEKLANGKMPGDDSPHALPTQPATARSFLDKPQPPYTVGATFIAKRHIPDKPRDGGYRDLYGEIHSHTRTATQLGYCLDHHPAPGEILDETHSFTIIKELRIGDQCNAQIVLTDNGKVAKIYDPLYYRLDYYDPV